VCVCVCVCVCERERERERERECVQLLSSWRTLHTCDSILPFTAVHLAGIEGYSGTALPHFVQ